MISRRHEDSATSAINSALMGKIHPGYSGAYYEERLSVSPYPSGGSGDSSRLNVPPYPPSGSGDSSRLSVPPYNPGGSGDSSVYDGNHSNFYGNHVSQLNKSVRN